MSPKILVPFFLLSCGFTSSFAQQRSCEMAVTLLSPSEGQTIPAYAQYNLTVRIVNNGPNDLVLGDTLWYNTPAMPAFSYGAYVLTQAIAANNSADVTLKTYANINTNALDETASFSVSVISNPGGNGAYTDPVLSNNTDANTITFKPCGSDGNGGGTAVNNVNAKNLSIQVFPNPASDWMQIFTGVVELNHVSLTDVTGRTVLDEATNLAAGKIFRLDIASLKSGLYFLKMETNKGTTISKFVKK